MSEWISVKDGLPNTDRPVLTYSPHMAMPVLVNFYSRYYGEDDDEWYERWAYRDDKITHWMESPKPPKEESNG